MYRRSCASEGKYKGISFKSNGHRLNRRDVIQDMTLDYNGIIQTFYKLRFLFSDFFTTELFKFIVIFLNIFVYIGF